MRVRLSRQVAAFARRLAPEPRQALRHALRDLACEKGDIKHLEGALDGYCRLRVGPHRVVFVYAPGRAIDCIFAERRSLVYEVFEEELIARLARPK